MPSYTIPTSEDNTDVDIADIKLPTDLLAQSGSEDGEAFVGDLYEMGYTDDIMERLSGMSINQKIDILMITTPEALTDKEKVTIAGDVFKDAYSSYPVTGLYFTDDNFTSEDDGMKMLKTIRGWSRNLTGMNVFLGYHGDRSDTGALSDLGLNLYCVDYGDDNAAEHLTEAAEANMLAAYVADIDDAFSVDEQGVFYIAKCDSAEDIRDAIKMGRTFLYLTENFFDIRVELIQNVTEGTIPEKALDKAAGYALTVRQTLTDIRPEDGEKSPEPEVQAAPAASTKKATTKKTMTPEEQAAAAAAEAQKQAEAALRELQKQAEDAMRAATKQAEGAGQ